MFKIQILLSNDLENSQFSDFYRYPGLIYRGDLGDLKNHPGRRS